VTAAKPIIDDVTEPLATPARIVFAGDWHMNATWAVAAIRHAAEGRADVMVHVGDFGYTFDGRFMRRLDAALQAAGLPLLFVDGNHEDFDSLLRWPIRPNGLRQLTDHVWHLPRGFRWTWGGVRLLAVGGAHSVDRQWRSPGTSWWPEETLTGDDVARAVAGGPVDVLVAHDCPAGVDIPGLAATSHLWPAEELALADEHRQRLRTVVDAARPRAVFHGHYHRRYSTTADLGYGPVAVVGLDCDGTTFDRNLTFVDLDDLLS